MLESFDFPPPAFLRRLHDTYLEPTDVLLMLAGAFSCRHLNTHWSDEYIVPRASDGYVTDTACSGRILLVEQQVSLSLFIRDRNRQTSDFHVAPCTVAESLHLNSTSVNSNFRESILTNPFGFKSRA